MFIVFSTCRDSERRRAAGRRSLPGFSECVLRVKLSGLSLGSRKKRRRAEMSRCPVEGPARLQPTAALTGVRVQIRLCSQLRTELKVPPAGTARKNSRVHSFRRKRLSALCGIFRKEPHVTGSVGRLQTALCDTVGVSNIRLWVMLTKHSCSKGKQSDLCCKCVK